MYLIERWGQWVDELKAQRMCRVEADTLCEKFHWEKSFVTETCCSTWSWQLWGFQCKQLTTACWTDSNGALVLSQLKGCWFVVSQCKRPSRMPKGDTLSPKPKSPMKCWVSCSWINRKQFCLDARGPETCEPTHTVSRNFTW